MNKTINLLELFSGIGGFAKGLQEAGFNIKSHQFSEIDKHAIANYKYNFKNSEYVGSVIDVQGSQINRPDIITFGSPCQDFSLAGKRSGMVGERSSLITEAIRLIGETKPSIFIWENVKGAFSSNNSEDFWAIIQAFTNIGGYRLEWQLLNTSWFLPQNRERIYLVGHLTGASSPKIFPITEAERGGIKKSAKTEVKAVLTPDRLEKRQNGRRFKNDGEPMFTLSCQDRHGVMINETDIRRLTEDECEILQGFPKDWTKYGDYGGDIKEISSTQRYKLCGNAVTVAVVKAVTERLL